MSESRPESCSPTSGIEASGIGTAGAWSSTRTSRPNSSKTASPPWRATWRSFSLRYQGLESELFIAFVRTASPGCGEPSHQNSHPFLRELNGRDFVLAHEGTLYDFREKLELGRAKPLGINDSEFLCCYLTGRIEKAGIRQWDQKAFAWLEQLLHETSALGSCTAMFSDGEYLFVYLDRRDANDLCYVQRQAPYGKVYFTNMKQEVDLGKVYAPSAKGYVIATRPLTSESWTPLAAGTLTVLKKGEIVYNSGGMAQARTASSHVSASAIDNAVRRANGTACAAASMLVSTTVLAGDDNAGPAPSGPAPAGAAKPASPEKTDILLLTDTAPGGIAAELGLLYPGRVKRVNFVEEKITATLLDRFRYVITVVGDGARSGQARLRRDHRLRSPRRAGDVQLVRVRQARNLHYSKTHVIDRIRPAMRIDIECDITKGFAVGDQVWWFGSVSSAPEAVYANQMVQRQVMGVGESDQVRILATSNVNHGAVMIEEKAGQGRIIALDLLSPGRPFYNSYGSTNKYLFLGNMINRAVHYGKQYPKRLRYDEFVAAMHELAAQHPSLTVKAEGPCSDGRQMYTFNIGDPAKPTMYFGGSIHGWEWENSYGLMRLAELLAENPRIEGLDTTKLHFKIMPVQNPWGHDHFTRQNARGVDLNRNFDAGWEDLATPQDIAMPWDYNYKGARPASERETQIIQGIVDRHHPMCVIDFHTADYVMLRAHRDNEAMVKAIHEDIKTRLKDRFVTQKPYNGPYQQVNMDNITEPKAPNPYLIDYAAKRGAPAAFLIEMSGNRDDVHALVMNVDTVVEICLAATKECLQRLATR